jgi:hypothetical protein
MGFRIGMGLAGKKNAYSRQFVCKSNLRNRGPTPARKKSDPKKPPGPGIAYNLALFLWVLGLHSVEFERY